MAAVESNLTMSTPSKSSNNDDQAVTPTPTTYATFAAGPLSLPKNTSPLLSSTPATVTKALSQAYPFFIAADDVLGLLTWTSDDNWKSFLLLALYVSFVLYFEILIKYVGHLIVVLFIAGYVWLSKSIERRQSNESSLDAIVHTLNNVTIRVNMFLLPLSSMALTSHEISRFLFTTLFMSPFYIITSALLLTPRSLALGFGTLVLTYHSSWARVTRAVLWRSRSVKLLTFYVTGLDFSGIKKKQFSDSQALRMKYLGVQSKSGKPVRFTYVLYENQRKWLAIGWTSNLLAYERTPWTDEFLNESNAPEQFKLPDAEGSGMEWRWVDKTWRLDLTNDGSLAVNSKSKSTTDPSPNDGYVFYDNTWKNPSAEDSYSKYTRRRRWIRTAELINAEQRLNDGTLASPSTTVDKNSEFSDISAKGSTAMKESANETRQRKVLRFDE